LACAIKWTGAQGVALALVTLGAAAWHARRTARPAVPTGWATVVLLGGGAVLYLASYLFIRPWGPGWLIRVLIWQGRMFRNLWGMHFANPALASPWTWWLFPAPVRLAVQLTAHTASQLLVMPNPVVMIAALGGGALAVGRIAHHQEPAVPWAWLAAALVVFWGFWLVPRHPTFVYYAYPLVPVTAIAAVAGWTHLRRAAQQFTLDLWLLSLVCWLPLWTGLLLPRVWAGLIAWPWH